MARGTRLLAFRRGTERVPSVLPDFWSVLAALLSVVPGGGPVVPESPPPGTPPTVESGGGIVTPKGVAPADLSDAIRRYFPADQWVNAAHVSYFESGAWNTHAVRDTRGRAGGRCGVPLGTLSNGLVYYSEWSIGYFQINACSHGGDFAYWSNPENNVRKAGELYAQSGWRPWTYTARQLGLL